MVNEEKIIQKLLDHDEKLARIEGTMATKDALREMTDILEDIATTVKDIRQEQITTTQWVFAS